MTSTETLHRPQLSEASPDSETVAEEVMARLDAFYSDGSEDALAEFGISDTPLKYAGQLRGNPAYHMELTEHSENNSYKIFGAVMMALAAEKEQLQSETSSDIKEVVAASAGNHGEAVAVVAKMMGWKATVLAAQDASPVKLKLSAANGAYVDNSYPDLPAALTAAEERAKLPGNVLIPPYNHYDVIAGQAIIGVRLVQRLLAQGVTGKIVAMVPVGGGGLISGLSIGTEYALNKAKAAGQDTSGFELEFIGVQMENGDLARRAVAALALDQPWQTVKDLFPDDKYDKSNDGTFAVPGDKTLAVLADKKRVSSIDLVYKSEVGQAMLDLEKRYGKRYEPAGALSPALALRYANAYPAERAGAEKVTLITFLTGANVTDDLFKEYAGAANTLKKAIQQAKSRELRAYNRKLNALHPRYTPEPDTPEERRESIRRSLGTLFASQVSASPVPH